MNLSQIVAIITSAKGLFQGVLALITLIVGGTALPFEEDLPLGLLAVLAVVEFYALTLVDRITQRQHLIVLLVAVLALSGAIYWYISRSASYSKTVDRDQSIWTFWRKRYNDIKVMGGLWLKPEARKTIGEEQITTQEYFEGNGFDEDQVWSRPSRLVAQLLVVMVYFAMTLSAAGLLLLVAESLMEDQKPLITMAVHVTNSSMKQ